MTTAVTYLRVSSADQVHNTSLDDQDARTKQHLAAKGWSLLRTFREEGKSAKDDDRPALKELLRFCAETEVDYVVCLDMSRLSRNTEAYLRIRRTLANVGTQLSFTSFDAVDTPEGKFMSTLQAAIAEFDNETRGLKAKRGMLATRRAGGWTTFAPKGYKCVRDGRLPSLEPNEDAPAVLAAFEDVASGKKTIQKAARSIGVSKGDEFFRRPVFAGFNEIDGELVRGKWPPIVPLSVWLHVQEQMKHRTHIKQTDFFLRGHLCCECGQMLTASYSKGRHKKYGYYHCTKCKARHSARELEDRFREWLDELAVQHKEVTATIKKDAAGRFKNLLFAAEAYKRKAADEANIISRRLSALVDLKIDGDISKEEYNAKRKELEARRKEVQRNILHGIATAEQFYLALEDAAFILSHFTEFLGKAGFEELMPVVRALVGSKTEVSKSGEFSNRENDGWYWLQDALDPEKREVAPPTGGFSNRRVEALLARVKVAKAIMITVMEVAQ